MAAPSRLNSARTELGTELLFLLNSIRVDNASPLFERINHVRRCLARLVTVPESLSCESDYVSDKELILRLMSKSRRLIQTGLMPFLAPGSLSPRATEELRHDIALLLDAIYQVEGICERAE